MSESYFIRNEIFSLIFLGKTSSPGCYPFIDKIYGYYLREQFNFYSEWIDFKLEKLNQYHGFPYQKIKQTLYLFEQITDNCYLMLCCQQSILLVMMNKLSEIIGIVTDEDRIFSKRELIDRSQQLLNQLIDWCQLLEIEYTVRWV